MIHYLAVIMAFLVGITTVAFLVAIFIGDLTWWSWLSISARPALLPVAALFNMGALVIVSLSRRNSLASIRRVAMIGNGILFIILTILYVGIYFLENVFHM
jgi:hypothetical protein